MAQRVLFVLLIFGSFPVFASTDAIWLQTQVRGSFYLATEDAVGGRGGLGVQVGQRLSEIGIFANFNFDQSFLNSGSEQSFFQLGPGIELITRSGLVRGSVSSGVTFEKDYRGWYVDVRPLSTRWKSASSHIFEWTLLSLDVSSRFGEETAKIAYFTNFAIEWAAR